MNRINSIDNYGFSELFYSDYWQNDEKKSKNLKNRGASHHESLKEYFRSKNPRKEIISIYTRFSAIDFKDYLATGYHIYLYDGLNITYDGLEECDLWSYLETKKPQRFILKELNKLFIFDIKQFIARKYFEHITTDYEFDWDSMDSNSLDFYLDNASNLNLEILEKMNQKISFSNEQKTKISKNYNLFQFILDCDVFNLDIFDVPILLKAINDEIQKIEETIEKIKNQPIGSWEKIIYKDEFERVFVSYEQFIDQEFIKDIRNFMKNRDYIDWYIYDGYDGFKEWYNEMKLKIQEQEISKKLNELREKWWKFISLKKRVHQ